MLSARSLTLLCSLLVMRSCDRVAGGPEENEGVRYANRCETCKILATELQARLQETGKSHDVLELGYSLDDVKPKKRTEYRRSELRLLESLENVCERILDYNLHKERTDSTRFAKGMSQTFQALHGLVDKGVKVDLGIPYELWDKPPVEVTQMKTQCEDMLEKYEDTIADWYFQQQDERTLIKHLCEDQVLAKDDRKCLTEKLVKSSKTDEAKEHDGVEEGDAEERVQKQDQDERENEEANEHKNRKKEKAKTNEKGDREEL